MIGKVMRGRKVGGLLRYLYGPGRANEHIDPHLVASWDDDPVSLEPALRPDGRHDLRQLAGLLEQPLAASVRTPERPVWHCAVRVAPGDRRLTDDEWRDVARDIVARTGLAPDGDDGACRWVAVRHADDHIHLVVTLARQDGGAARTSNDFYRVGEACRAAETRLGLTTTAPRDRTAAKRATRGETEKAARAGRREPARVTLQREVRTAAAGAATADEFLARLADAGLLVRPRFSDTDPEQVTGYAVALPGDRAGDSRPVWFGGGKLAADLSWPKLSRRWSADGATPDDSAADAWRVIPGLDGATVSRFRGAVRARLTGADRDIAWRHAVRVAATAADELRQLAATDPATAGDIAHATGRALTATARVIEGRRGGPLTDAADTFDRAARDLHGRLPRQTTTGSSLRAAARLLALTGRAAKDEVTQVLALIANLTALVDAVAELRDRQERVAQAAAARAAAEQLASARAGAQAPNQPAVIHRPGQVSAIHRSLRPNPTPRPSRRKVQP